MEEHSSVSVSYLHNLTHTIMEEEDDDDDDDEVELQKRSHDSEPSYSILNEAQIRQRLEDDIATVSTTLSESRASAIVLLRRFNWNISKLFDNWFDDELGVRTKLGLFATPIVAIASSDRPITCGICFEKFPYSPNAADSTLVSASCGHLYCRACWSRYIAKSISDDGPGCLMLTCPDPSCVAAIGEDMIGSLAMSHSDREKFSLHLLRSYVEDSCWRRKIRWCPAPNCNYAIDFTRSDGGSSGSRTKSLYVNCRCSHSFCWTCGEDVHRPVDCDMAAKWMSKNTDESESMNWILVNTKPCPRCKRPIEKIQGCNSMTCAAPCRHMFCWHCLGELSIHSSHSCIKFLPEQGEGEVLLDATEEERRRIMKESLSKYGHYYERWVGNLSSRKKAVEDLKALQGEPFDRLGMYYGQQKAFLEFIIEACRQIIRCRKVLQWSYVYGYYFPEDQWEKKQLFEYLQGQAEFSLERIHDCVEQELKNFLEAKGSLKDFFDYRRKVSVLTCVTGNHFENLVKAVEDGPSQETLCYWSCKVCSFVNSTPRCYMCDNHCPQKVNYFLRVLDG